LGRLASRSDLGVRFDLRIGFYLIVDFDFNLGLSVNVKLE